MKLRGNPMRAVALPPGRQRPWRVSNLPLFSGVHLWRILFIPAQERGVYMNPVGRSGIRSHLTLAFPMKSPEESQALAQELPSLAIDVLKAMRVIGTVHYSRFIVLSDRPFSSSPISTMIPRNCFET
jgi:hypothetical protein